MAHLNAAIISLSQDMDLASGTMANFMLVQLPSGRVIRALIEDDAAQEIVSLVMGSGEKAGKAAASESFSKEDMDWPLPDDLPSPALEEASPPPKPASPPARRARYVGKDDLGYPILHVDDAVELRDEDGVGQV